MYLSQSVEDSLVSFGKVPVHDGGEDTSHCVIIKAVNADNVEVSSEAISDGVPTTSWRTHPTNQQLQ